MSHSNNGVNYTPQISRTGASIPDPVSCFTMDTTFFSVGESASDSLTDEDTNLYKSIYNNNNNNNSSSSKSSQNVREWGLTHTHTHTHTNTHTNAHTHISILFIRIWFGLVWFVWLMAHQPSWHVLSREHPGACSGLRSGAWLCKRNNCRLEAFRLLVSTRLPPGGRAALLSPL